MRAFRTEMALFRRVVADPQCPRAAKWLLVAAIAYALNPIDIIPDFLPVIGHLDDVVVLPLLVWLALKLLPANLVAEHREQLTH